MWLSGSLQADSQPGSFGLVWGRQPLGTVPYSSHEPGALAVALSYDDSTINIVVGIIIIIIITYIIKSSRDRIWETIIMLI